MVKDMSIKSEICPTLREIICQFDQDSQCSRQAFNIGQTSDPRANVFYENEDNLDNSSGNHDDWFLNHNDYTTNANDNIGSEDLTFESRQVFFRHDTTEYCKISLSSASYNMSSLQ